MDRRQVMQIATGAMSLVTFQANAAERAAAASAAVAGRSPEDVARDEDYLEQALTAYHNGRRKNVVMNGMSQLLTSPADIKIAAEYFASQDSPLAAATPTSK